MGFFKSLACIAGGVAFAPFTAGASLVVGIGAAAATANGAVKYASEKIEEGKNQARAEGVKSGERSAQTKYEKKVTDLTERLQGYHDLDQKVLALYAVGLAVASADGNISLDERREIDEFVTGCLSADLPTAIKDVIAKLSGNPPSLKQALEFAVKAKLCKQDIQDVIDVVVMADGKVCESEEKFIAKWKRLATQFELA